MFALLLQKTSGTDEEKLTEAKATLEARDFRHMLKRRITACLLSPNLTAYVTDTTDHIMMFMQEHQEIFKAPKIFFKDVELNEILKKLVTDTLASCQERIKTCLIQSLCKGTSIMDVLQAVSMGNMEINAAHWTRFSFLIFLIGTHGFKEVSMLILLSSNIVDYLHPDLHSIIKDESGFSVETLIKLPDKSATKDTDDDLSNADAEGEIDDEYYPSAPPCGQKPRESDPLDASELDDLDLEKTDGHDGNGNCNDEGKDEGNNDAIELDANSGWSGFRTLYPKWTSKKFWGFVDYTLEQCRQFSKENSNTPTEFEEELKKYVQRKQQAS
ncbi:hypothetical protein J3R83DRAFT_9936 [Lanmaoa asiatica]|nr:hypothetical protein J3R83DRAFT_9936 [Lanmaoa asiatica]